MKQARMWWAVLTGILIIGLAGLFFTQARSHSVDNDSQGSTATPAGSDDQRSIKEDESKAPGTQNTTSQAVTAANTVTMKDIAFNPSSLKVKKGTTVVWKNDDPLQHNVVSDADSPNRGLASQLLQKGQTYSYKFTQTGTYKYHCEPHSPTMKGTIIVTE